MRLYIKQVCWYAMRCYTIIGIVFTPEQDGFRIALKIWNRHMGLYLTYVKPESCDKMYRLFGQHYAKCRLPKDHPGECSIHRSYILSRGSIHGPV